jgi:hypothetical protein
VDRNLTDAVARDRRFRAGLLRASVTRLQRNKLTISVALLCLLAAVTAVGPLYRATFLAEIDRNEGWVAYHVDAILKGFPFYPAPDQLITNNYPPLFYYITAAVTHFTGNAIYAGRALAFVALLAIVVEIYFILRLLAVRRLFSAVAALAFFATLCRLFDGKVAVNDPQLMAHAVMLLGLCCFLWERTANSRWSWPSAALMVTAGFIKHNLIAVPLSTFALLLWEDRGRAIRFAMVGAGLALTGLGICVAVYGSDFIYNMFSPRPYHWARGFKALEDLHRVPVQFLLWLWFALTVADGRRGRIINVLCATALMESFLVRGGEEVDKNAGFDLVIALHLALGVALERADALRVPRISHLSTVGLQTAAIGILTVRLLFGEPMDSFNVLYKPAMADWYRQAERATAEEAKRISAIPGAVYCDSPLLCYLAGKEFAVDSVNLGFRIGTGRVSCDVVRRQLASGLLTYVPAINANLRPYRLEPEEPGREHSLEALRKFLKPVGTYLSPPSTSIFCQSS